jgi:hypothetical protein
MTMGTSWQYGEGDYRAIEDALRRSDYGRWFLGEYLARNRSEETDRLLDALDRLEVSFAEAATADPVPRLREIALEIDVALEGTLSHLCPEAGAGAPAEDAPVERILEAVEDINGFLETLHTRRVNLRLAEKIRCRLGDIQTACARVDAVAAPGLATLLAELRQRLAGVSAELAVDNPSAPPGADAHTPIPQQVIDELAAAFFSGGQWSAAR